MEAYLMQIQEMIKKFNKNEDAFTGLEAAIVLTAFIVVAAVFSYVVLGAGFYTSDTAKQTVQSGVEQTTASVELTGDVIGHSSGYVDATPSTHIIDEIQFVIELTAGGSPVDIGASSTDGALVVSYLDTGTFNASLDWDSTKLGNYGDGDNVLEEGEKFQITAYVPGDSLLQDNNDAPNAPFTLQIQPKDGAPLPLSRTAPPQIDPYMKLV
jgi:flagellin FlaB